MYDQKILFGLCHLGKKTEDTIVCSAPELNWLAENPFSRAGQWRGPGGRFRSLGGEAQKGDVLLDRKTRLDDKIDGYLSHLETKGLIICRKTDFLYRINLTAHGLEDGGSLRSKKRRMFLWIKDNCLIFVYLAIVGFLALVGVLYAGLYK